MSHSFSVMLVIKLIGWGSATTGYVRGRPIESTQVSRREEPP